MATYIPDRKEISFKVVYCGAPLSGKTTNLLYIHKRLDPHFRGDLISLATEEDRTLFFDFLPVNASRIGEYNTKFQLFTVPGQKAYARNREIVLQDSDGIVFVADSAPDQVESNLEALQSVRQSLERNDLDPDEIPFVFQFNKRDLPGALPPEEMDQYLHVSTASFLSCALSGYQVFSTLDYLTQILIKNFHYSNVKRLGQLDEENVASSSKIALSS